MTRDALLERCPFALLDSVIMASRVGEDRAIKGHGRVRVFPRIKLCAGDHPEQQHVLGLRLNEGMKPFNLSGWQGRVRCMQRPVRQPGRARNAEVETGGRCPVRHGHRNRSAKASFRRPLCVPLCACPGGRPRLENRRMSLYMVFGFDLVHVCMHCPVRLYCDRDLCVARCAQGAVCAPTTRITRVRFGCSQGVPMLC